MKRISIPQDVGRPYSCWSDGYDWCARFEVSSFVIGTVTFDVPIGVAQKYLPERSLIFFSYSDLRNQKL